MNTQQNIETLQGKRGTLTAQRILVKQATTEALRAEVNAPPTRKPADRLPCFSRPLATREIRRNYGNRTDTIITTLVLVIAVAGIAWGVFS